MEKKEKKVEYLELIYDLMFVYMIGRCNSLIHNLQGGFISGQSVFVYIVYTLAVIQIWNFSTYYMNIYGENSLRNHIFIFINMFFLYFMGSSTKMSWRLYQTRHHVAWVIILLNIAIQYFIELRHNIEDERESSTIKRVLGILILEVVLIACAVLIQDMPGMVLAGIAVLIGILTTVHTGRSGVLPVDFMHLSERAMLLVVFTFGEMIIAISGYFDEVPNLVNLYFALMTFLIVVGLFLSYEVLYDHIIDRDMQTGGLSYMCVHVLMVFGLNSISAAFQFMPEEEVDLMPKLLLLILAFLVYYGCLFATREYAKPMCRHDKNLYLPVIPVTLVFVVMTLLFRNRMLINILVSAFYVYLVYIMLHRYAKRLDKKCGCQTEYINTSKDDSITVTILCGGDSTRMGKPKVNLKIGGLSFVEIITERLSQADEFLLSVRNKDDYPNIPIRHISDLHSGCGPMAGIYSALKDSRNELVFMIACDMPFVTWDTVEKLYHAFREDSNAVFPVSADGKKYAVCGLYHKNILPTLESMLASGEHRLQRVTDYCECVLVPVEQFDDYQNVFRNINTIEDYEEVCR